MPLPLKTIEWPPAELATVLPAMRTYDTWVTGGPNELLAAYKGNHPAQYSGGVKGALARAWWGKPAVDGEVKRHAPLAADICDVNADLLFADPITATVVPANEGAEPDASTEARLELITASLHDLLISAASTSAMLGGTYLRATWDDKVSDNAFVTKVDADQAWPVFRWGRLVSVIFWRRLHTHNGVVWRHLESHEVDEQGIGVIRHGLYEGTEDFLGAPRPFTDRTETEWLATQPLIDGNTISTLTPGLDVVYVRNREDSKQWRKDPLGANLGGSDLEKVLGELSDYDETYTSLMQDLKDGRSRLIVAEQALTNNGPGKGMSFEDRRLFMELGGVGPTSMKEAKQLPIEQVQFGIRVEEHHRIMDDLMHRIIRSAGYSPRSFGIYADGDKTATEVTSEDELSTRTRKRKIRAFEPALEYILAKCLAIDSVILRGGGRADATVSVQFAEANKETPLALSQLVTNLRNARAASTKTVVSIMHPDWDEPEIDEEVARILAEDGLPPLADPDDRPDDATLV